MGSGTTEAKNNSYFPVQHSKHINNTYKAQPKTSHNPPKTPSTTPPNILNP
jgi:hypothetical protein